MLDRRSTFIGFSDFTNQLSMSYVDYLQAKQFEDSIRFGMRQQTKELIATNTELARSKINVLEQTKDAMRDGFVTLSRELKAVRDAIEDGLTEINATFEWGFSEVLISIGSMTVFKNLFAWRKPLHKLRHSNNMRLRVTSFDAAYIRKRWNQSTEQSKAMVTMPAIVASSGFIPYVARFD